MVSAQYIDLRVEFLAAACASALNPTSMRRLKRFVLVAAGLGIFFACETGGASDTEVEQPETPVVDEPIEEPEQEIVSAFVTAIASVKKQPTKDSKIEITDKSGQAKKVSNWVGTVYRGEEVDWIETDGDWALVRLSDDKEGFIETKRLLKAGDATMTVATTEVKTYTRPDMLNLNSKRVITPGSLIFIVRDKNEFSEVDMPATHYSSLSAWVVKDKLSTNDREISAARLFAKWRYLSDKEKPDAVDIAGLIKSEFSDTSVAALILAAEEQAASAAEPEADGKLEEGAEGTGAAPAGTE